MKKEYVSPATQVANVELQQMIAESLGLGQYGGNTGLTGNHNKLWEEEEDEDDLDLGL